MLFLLFIIAGGLILTVDSSSFVHWGVLSWGTTALCGWFSANPIGERRKGRMVAVYYADMQLAIPLLLSYIIAGYVHLDIGFSWPISWVLLIHTYAIFHSRVNCSPIIKIKKRTNKLCAFLIALTSPIVFTISLIRG